MEKIKESIPEEKIQDSLEELETPRPVEEEDPDPVEKPLREGLSGE
nr:hypothetical protein [uncultured Draconibacterium sp.]